MAKLYSENVNLRAQYDAIDAEFKRQHTAGEYFEEAEKIEHIADLMAYVSYRLADLPANKQLAYRRYLSHFAAVVEIELEKMYGPLDTRPK